GTIRNADACDPCFQDIDGLVAWFDTNGNPLAAWSLDSPVDPPPTPYCDQPTSTEWGCGLAMNGLTAYFSLATTMPYNGRGDALVGSLNVGTGFMNWSGRITDLWPSYHCVEQA